MRMNGLKMNIPSDAYCLGQSAYCLGQNAFQGAARRGPLGATAILLGAKMPS